jgi:hypothetical protein
MAPATLKNILAKDFRANPAYELVEFDRLTRAEQAALPGLRSDDDCFGVLRPVEESGLGIKAVCKDTALLFYALGSPGGLPVFVTRLADHDVNARIAELVLDGVLQIGVGDGFFSGAEAHHLIHEPAQMVDNLSRIARISLEALRFGQRLPLKDPLTLSAQLYFFNRMPVTPRLQRRFGEESAMAHFVGTDSGGLGKTLRTDWKESERTPEMQGWRRWSMRDARYHGSGEGYDYKIYVSPTLEGVPEILPEIVDVFAEKRVRMFKMGADVAGLCRADKIVAYLDSFDHVDEVGRMLDERLGDIPVHGVPFTADLYRDGLVSWGMDPYEPLIVDGQERASWRLWITNRLACALLHARSAARTAVEPWRFALERVRLEGIDTDTWTPLSGYRGKSQIPDRPVRR